MTKTPSSTRGRSGELQMDCYGTTPIVATDASTATGTTPSQRTAEPVGTPAPDAYKSASSLVAHTVTRETPAANGAANAAPMLNQTQARCLADNRKTHRFNVNGRARDDKNGGRTRRRRHPQGRQSRNSFQVPMRLRSTSTICRFAGMAPRCLRCRHLLHLRHRQGCDPRLADDLFAKPSGRRTDGAPIVRLVSRLLEDARLSRSARR